MSSTLTPEAVAVIKRLISVGGSDADVASCLGVPIVTVQEVRREQVPKADPRLEAIASECRAIRLERAASDDWPEDEDHNEWTPPVVKSHPVEFR